MFRFSQWSPVAAMMMVAVPAVAQEPTRLEPVVVTATKLETPQERLGASVTVITEEEIEARDYDDLGDVLRQVPGVEIQRSGSRGKLTTLKIRGANRNQVQVLVDGLRVKSPTDGGFDFSDLALNQIERIEIVRGPQATLYGADAIGGVVNIITKRGEGPPTGTVSLQGGNFGTHSEQASFSGGYKLLDYAVSGSFLASGGQFDNDDFEQQAVAVRLGLALPSEGHISLSTRYTESSTDLPVDITKATPPFFVLDPDSQQDNALTTLSVLWEHKPVGWYEGQLRFGHFWNQLDFKDPSDPAVSDIDTERREIELLNHFHAGKWSTLSVGLEHRTDKGDFLSEDPFIGSIDISEEITVRSVFVQAELRLLDLLFLSGGVRVEDNDVFGTETTPRVGWALLIRETGSKLRASWGEGFRAPTINDLFFPDVVFFVGNPDLRPEKSRSVDFGVDQELWANRVRLGVTYFWNTFDDLIQIGSVGGKFRPENVAQARTQGVEVVSEGQLFDGLVVAANYTYTDTEDRDTGQELRRFARHRWNFGLFWDPVRALDLFVQANLVSSQFELEGFPRNPGYHRIDVGGTYHLVERRGAFPALDLIARVQNLTDEDYSEVFGFEALGINALAGVQARY